MKLALVPIGNSRGIRIPKTLIEQCGFGKTVEVRIEQDRLVIQPDRTVRQGWDAAFRAAVRPAKDELLLDPAPSNEFDRKDWRW